MSPHLVMNEFSANRARSAVTSPSLHQQCHHRVTVPGREKGMWQCLRGFAKNFFKKFEITMEVGGWGGSRSHSEFVFLNHPKNSTDILE